MEDLVQKRLSLILSLVVGTAGGFSLSAFINAQELKPWLAPIAIAFSLIVSILISGWFKNSTAKKQKRFIRYAVISLLLFVITMSVFFISYNTLETRMKVNIYNDDDSTYTTTDSVFIKGLYYTPQVKSEIAVIQESNKKMVVPLEHLERDADYNIDAMWDTDSRILAKLLLVLTYILFIGSFIAGLTIVTEVAQKKSTAKK